MKHLKKLIATTVFATMAGCGSDTTDTEANNNPAVTPAADATVETMATVAPQPITDKPVIYQVMTRLFGNTNDTNKPWGTLEENGVGKFSDFTPEALAAIRDFGATHIWYTGALHHAVVRDYKEFGISDDDPDVVKGRAGSPYAIKDYYSVNPDLADDPAARLDEFRDLIQRSHDAGLKVVIDIVPNHVARAYQSVHKPEGVRDFGADDDTSVTYARDNNFYYVIGEDFKVPEGGDYQPLNGEAHPLVDGQFAESPAKWTGNGARAAQPDVNDWYETVKINFGVRPDGSHDFPALPDDYAQKDYRAHAAFWSDKDVPDSWIKFRDIAYYWLDQGVDGFRYDMSGMVPVEFWSYLNSAIKMRAPETLLLAEIYTPERYRDYIFKGKMDYLYDKVGTYDAIRAVMEGKASADALVEIQESLEGIAPNMLRFMENHDEQRIASPEFAGNAAMGRPAMIVSAAISAAPTLVYFGQELGEPGAKDAGFGKASRTTIFDYWSVPSVRQWINKGADGKPAFDGGQLTDAQRELRAFYKTLNQISTSSPALRGNYGDLHEYNRANSPAYTGSQFAFARWDDAEKLLVLANFSRGDANTTLLLPAELVEHWQLSEGDYPLSDLLDSAVTATLKVRDGSASAELELAPMSGHILKLGNR